MNMIGIYLLQISITGFISLAVVIYFRPHLSRILTDLCGTPERAQFWVVFANIFLLALPLVFSMGYHPQQKESLVLFFSVTQQIRNNLLGLIFALLVIGSGVSFFALIAPHPSVK